MSAARNHTYFSELEVDACRLAIRRATRDEDVDSYDGRDAVAVCRERGADLEVRFKMRRQLLIHNWFALSLSTAEGKSTKIDVRERRGAVATWWIPGLLVGILVGLVTIRHFSLLATLIAACVVEGGMLLLSLIAAAFDRDGDRRRLWQLLESAARRVNK